MYSDKPNILMVYPETPATFWSFKEALRFISKRSSEPPLGLITVAAMLPDDWNIRLIDMNVSTLKEQHIRESDAVFLSGMNIHRESFKAVVNLCNRFGKMVIAGGPMVTTDHHEFLGIDSFIIGEAENIVSCFIQDYQEGTLKKLYKAEGYPDVSRVPVPRWDLLELEKYASMSVQYSRGCPFNCDFCSITFLNGRKPRTKTAHRFITELQSLYDKGWRGNVFIVDDNFIGNINRVKKDLLPALAAWSKLKKYPFKFMTEASVNLADDDELMSKMVDAGFDSVFVGIETPDKTSLAGCGKSQNVKGNLTNAVQKLHRKGLMVAGGFIVGFDQDKPDIFERQIQFIKSSKIVTAMVGMLNAPTGTRLFERLKKENRLIETMSGDNMDGSMNFIPRMDYKILVQGYHRILDTIYSHKIYYNRVRAFLSEYSVPVHRVPRIRWTYLRALIKSFWVLGIRDAGRRHYWELLFYTLRKFPEKFVLAVTLAVYGYHFRTVVKNSG